MAAIKVVGRFGLRQAIKAAEIAPVSDADAEVAENPSKRVNELRGTTHLMTGTLVPVGEFVSGGTTLTDPSARTSTLRS
jgi:hypothetical protein